MMPGTGTTAITDTVLLTRQAAEMGCRGALLLPPFYYKNPTEDGLFAYFSEVINRVGSDIKYYLYNFPQQSAVPLTVDLFARLLKALPGVLKGVKDSSGNYDNGRAYVENFAKDGFEVYAGDDTLLRPLLQFGSAGCITAAANVNSPIAAQVYANWNNDLGAAGTRNTQRDAACDRGRACRHSRIEGTDGASYRRRGVAQHAAAASQVEQRTAGEAVCRVRCIRRATGESRVTEHFIDNRMG